MTSVRAAEPSLDLSGLRLGSFTLRERIGVGGMSEVWAGHDAESGADVAVKLLFEPPRRRDEARRRARTDALFKELHALARLDHPGILPLLDFGTIDPATEARTSSALLAGSPYLVTPRVLGGSLDNEGEPTSFAELLEVLLALAAALGHAHARGVVHRDLKPANVLLDVDAHGTSRPVLSDFGISFAREEGPDAPSRAGTPSTMAPEQIRGLRDQGPATDLYALGCVAYRLATGRPPFVGTADEVLRAHLLSAPPALAPLFEVPRAFDDWLRVLLEKRASARFASARAAAHALATLAASPKLPARPRVMSSLAATQFDPDLLAAAAARRREEPTQPGRLASTVTAPSVRPPRGPEELAQVPSDGRVLRASLFPPPPTDVDWRSLEGAVSRFGVTSGSGLALFGLRSVPLSGRQAARDRLFSALAGVARLRTPRVVLLTGPLGIGATRLAEWMLETAAELDLATIARTACSAAGRRGDALVVLLERLVRVRGLVGDERREQVRAWLDDVTRHAPDARDEADLLALVSRDATRLVDGGPRHAALRRLLGRAASRRPLVVLIDDAVLDGDVVAFLESLARASEASLPVLALVTATDEALAEHPMEADALRRIAEGPRGEHLGLGPLDARETEALAEGPLGLAPSLAREVAERSQGHPLFAVQLVGDWISKGVLERGIEGNRLREGTRQDVPDGVHVIFEARLASLRDAVRARSGSPEDADRVLVALEIAAVLDANLEPDAWLALSTTRGGWASEEALRLPEARGLIRWRTGRFELAHPLLRESLLRRAREGGRFEAHHSAAADLLEASGGDPRHVAAHRLAAGQTSRALSPLIAGVERLIDRSDLLGAHDALDRYEAALEVLGAPPDDERRLPMLLGRAEAFAQAAYLDRAEAMVAEAAEIARAPVDRATVAQLRGVLFGRRGATALSVAAFEEALAMLDEGRLGVRVAMRARYGIAEARKLTGDFASADAAYREVLAGTSPDERLHAMALVGLSDSASRTGRPDDALLYGHEALRRLEQKSYWHAVAVTHNSLGDLERRRGRHDEAEAHYRESLEIMLVVGSADAAIVRMNLALVAIARGDLEGAEATLVVARTGLEGRERDLYVHMCDALRLPSAIARRDREAAESLLVAARRACDAVADPDLGGVLARAAELAREAGWNDLAPTLVTLAATQEPHPARA